MFCTESESTISPNPWYGMELQILGTASAKPHKNSNLSSALLRLRTYDLNFSDTIQLRTLFSLIAATALNEPLSSIKAKQHP